MFSSNLTRELEPNVEKAFLYIKDFKKKVDENRNHAALIKRGLDIFEIDEPDYHDISDTEKDLGLLEKIWTLSKDWMDMWQNWKVCICFLYSNHVLFY